MIDIHHRIGVESPSTDGVYAALTTIDGLAGWWTSDTTGDPEPRRQDRVPVPARAGSTWRWSSSCRASASAGGSSTGRPSGSAPPSTGGSPAATGTRSCCSRHEGWAEPVEFLSHCSTKWASYLLSLKALVETGTGRAVARRRARSATGTEPVRGASRAMRPLASRAVVPRSRLEP